jgi:capsular polysaccharide biosynthesis protein
VDWAILTIESNSHRIALNAQMLTRLAFYAVLIVVVASLAGYFIGTRGETLRAAQSEVLYELQAEQPAGNLRQDRQLTTQLVTVRSRAVLEPVAEANGLTVDDLSQKLDVSVAEDSEVVRIEVHDPSAARAKALVDGITREYLARVRPNRAAEARQYLDGQLAELEQRQQELATRLAALRSAAPTSPELTQVTVEMQSLFARRSDLQSRLSDVTVDEIREPQVQEITKAHVLQELASPSPWRAAAVGALTGLVVAAIAVVFLLRRRTLTPRDA